MVRHSPKAEVTEPKMPQGIDMGLRFGHNEEVWLEKSQKGAQPADHNPASGPGPYFPGPLQVIKKKLLDIKFNLSNQKVQKPEKAYFNACILVLLI